MSSIKPSKKELKTINKLDRPEGRSRLNTTFQNTEPCKPNVKKDELIKKMPITTRNRNTIKLGQAFTNSTLLSESNESVKKNLNNKFNIENVKKNFTRRNLSVKIIIYK